MLAVMSKPLQLDPAKSVIQKAGGVDAVAKITGRHVSRIYRWMQPKEHGGTGGFVPQPEAMKILQHAKDKGLDLSAADFFGEAA